MDRKTVIAVVLAVVVIIGSMLVQTLFFPQTKPSPQALPPETAPQKQEQPQAGQPPAIAEAPAGEGETLTEESFILETDVLRVGFTNRGAAVTSIHLKEYKNRDGSPVEMVLSKGTGLLPFSIHFGDHNAEPVKALFRMSAP